MTGSKTGAKTGPKTGVAAGAGVATALALARRLMRGGGVLYGRAVQVREHVSAAPDPVGAMEDAPLDVLAAKIMFTQLRNRQQLLGPPPTAFGHLDQGQTELLIRAAALAAASAGHRGEAEERRLRGALSAVGLVDAALSPGEALRLPAPLETLLRGVHDPHVASLFYAASLLAIDTQDPVVRAYLAYLALRLKLPADIVARLHSQHGVG